MILLPGAEPLLDAARKVDPALVRPGLPAHVTALYPFLSDAELTGDVLAAVRSVAAAAEPVDVTLGELVTNPGFAAVPVPQLQPLTDAACARWPEVQPYGGRFGPRPPAHLTVAMGGPDADLAGVAAEAGPLLPLTARAEALELVALTEQGWQRRLSVPLGACSGPR